MTEWRGPHAQRGDGEAAHLEAALGAGAHHVAVRQELVEAGAVQLLDLLLLYETVLPDGLEHLL